MTLRYRGLLVTDIDGTLFRWSIFLYVVMELIKRGLFPASVGTHIDGLRRKWRDRHGTYDEYLMAAVGMFEQYLPGMAEQVFAEVCQAVVARRKDEVYQYMRSLIRAKLAEGWYVCAISASPEYAVQAFSESWGLTDWAGTVNVTANGLFTGERRLMHAKAKAAKVRQLLALPELADLQPENFIACGDTLGDVPMLELAGVPIAFNPADDLAAEAEKRGWPSVTERKNVITETCRGQYIKYTFDVDGTKRFLTERHGF